MKKLFTPQQERTLLQMVRFYNALVTGVVLDTKDVLKILKKK